MPVPPDPDTDPADPPQERTDGVPRSVLLDTLVRISYNPRIMDSLSVFEIPTDERSSLLLWSSWAAPAVRWVRFPVSPLFRG